MSVSGSMKYTNLIFDDPFTTICDKPVCYIVRCCILEVSVANNWTKTSLLLVSVQIDCMQVKILYMLFKQSRPATSADTFFQLHFRLAM